MQKSIDHSYRSIPDVPLPSPAAASRAGKNRRPLVLFITVFLLSFFSEAKEIKHFKIPSGPIDNKMIEDLLRVVAVDCDYVDTHDAYGHRQTAVALVKIYEDKTTDRVFLPHVYSTRRDAMGNCGEWIDQFEAQWQYAHRLVKTQQVASH